MKTSVSVLMLFVLLVTQADAATKILEYQVPSVKDSYCGSIMNFQYCKCAFHDQYCEVVGMTPSTAHAYVQEAFREWNKVQIEEMARECLVDDGYWNTNNWTCTKCTDGDVLSGGKCVQSDEDAAAAKECREALKNFDQEWEKYSDLDRRSGTDISWEVQQFNSEFNDIAELVALANEIEYELAIMAELRLEMRAYKAALVQNVKVNLLKAFWRLSYTTYSTIKSGLGMKGTVEKLVDPDNVVQGVGAGLKLLQSQIPPHEKNLQIDTSTTEGKVKSMAWNATLEALESVGDPADIAKQFMKDARGAVVPSADISDEEIEILRTQHLSNNAVDEALASSYAEAAELRKTLIGTRKLITEKYNNMQEWKVKEYERVKYDLEEQCKDKLE